MLILAEAFGALALILNFFGYRQHDVNRYRLISAIALLSLSIHFVMLDAMAAGVGCALACIRNIVAIRYRGTGIVITFVAINIAFLGFEWFVLENSWIILIAYSSSLIFTVGSIVLQDAMRIRQWFILGEVLGLIYALMVGSIFGSIFNISNLVSITLTLRKELQVTKLHEQS